MIWLFLKFSFYSLFKHNLLHEGEVHNHTLRSFSNAFQVVSIFLTQMEMLTNTWFVANLVTLSEMKSLRPEMARPYHIVFHPPTFWLLSGLPTARNREFTHLCYPNYSIASRFRDKECAIHIPSDGNFRSEEEAQIYLKLTELGGLGRPGYQQCPW